MLIAIDGGGTKTEAVLTLDDGTVVALALAGPSNPNSVGLEAALGVVRGLLHRILQRAEQHGEPIRAAFVGLAGAGREPFRGGFHVLLRGLLPGARTRAHSDAVNCLSSGAGARDGVVLVAGTGSSAFARVGEAFYQVGGWGHMIDDAGAGYEIGRRGLRAVLRAYDGRGQPTALTALFEAYWGGAIADAVPHIHAEGKGCVASFAPLVLNCEDPTATAIVEQAARDLADMVIAAARHVPGEDACPLVLAGGLWKSRRLRELVSALLPARVEVILPDMPPVFGAAVEAARDAGFALGSSFLEAFKAAFACSYMDARRTTSRAASKEKTR